MFSSMEANAKIGEKNKSAKSTVSKINKGGGLTSGNSGNNSNYNSNSNQPTSQKNVTQVSQKSSRKISNPTSNSNKNLISSPVSGQGSADEYQGISYKTSIAPIKTVDLFEEKPEKKKSIEKDFRIKYKTEKCKFYEVNMDCKYGDNVKKLIKINKNLI